MKLTSFVINGVTTYGLFINNKIHPVTGAFQKRYPDLVSVFAADALSELQTALSEPVEESEITFLPLIPRPNKVIAIGLNYVSHIKETGRDAPKHPIIFNRYANSQVGHNQALIRPTASDKLDFEGELGVVISKSCRHVAKEDAESVIAGYCCFNDGSIRDFQRHTSQFGPGKSFYKSGSFGPYLVTPDEAPKPDDMVLTTRLNGNVMQHTGVDDLLFKVPDLIHYASTVTELEPGDVIATGTTSGVGLFRDPPVFMKPGDVVEIEITGLGILRNTIEDE